jgi:hypothetical protein
VALSRVKTLSGLYLVGYNDMALKVHPSVLEKDIEFKEKSEEAEYEFHKIKKTDLYKMQENFINHISIDNTKSKKKITKKKKGVDYDFEEVIY